MTRPYLQFFTNLWLGICLTFLISGCATTQPQPVPYPDRPIVNPQIPQPEDKTPRPVDEPEVENPDDTDVKSGLTPAFMDTDNIKRIAMILPFSSRSKALRAEADAMLKAAELSVFDNGDKNVLLIPIDGGGTQTGSRRAAQKAIEQGADIILGPIKASSVSAVGNIAARSHIPVIGFSNDMRAAGSGVFLLSFPPEAETRRIVDFAAEQGATKFAFLGPDSVYGRRVLAAYRDTITKTGGELTAVETYAGDDISVMQGPAERLARTYAQTREAALAKGETDPEPAFHAVLLPEKGTALRSLAPLLPYFDDSLRDVQFMGTGRWNSEDVAKEPALNGGVYAGPELTAKQAFEANFDATFGQEVKNLTSLAYDAVRIGSFVLDAKPKERVNRLADPVGFSGVDGFVRFGLDGIPRRGLAVFQFRNGHIVEIDPAPHTLTDPS